MTNEELLAEIKKLIDAAKPPEPKCPHCGQPMPNQPMPKAAIPPFDWLKSFPATDIPDRPLRYSWPIWVAPMWNGMYSACGSTTYGGG